MSQLHKYRQLSPNFNEREFRCRDIDRRLRGASYCNGSVGKGIDLRLIQGLEELRARIGRPINVSSGYRCPAYNRYLAGTASNSQHMYGVAADIWIQGMSSEQIMVVVEELDIGTGRGLYPGQGIVHIDVRRGLRGRGVHVSRWVKQQGRPYLTVATFQGWL